SMSGCARTPRSPPRWSTPAASRCSADKGKRQKIYTRIKGHFDGWSGRNEYTLANGQVWKQIGSETVPCLTADNPSAKVKPSAIGNWLMYVSGCNDSVHVERVR